MSILFLLGLVLFCAWLWRADRQWRDSRREQRAYSNEVHARHGAAVGRMRYEDSLRAEGLEPDPERPHCWRRKPLDTAPETKEGK